MHTGRSQDEEGWKTGAAHSANHAAGLEDWPRGRRLGQMGRGLAADGDGQEGDTSHSKARLFDRNLRPSGVNHGM